MALTDAKIRNTKPADKPLKLTDSGGLFLLVSPNGSKLWRYRFRIAGKENLFALGEYPALSLSDARTARDEARQLVKQGINPAHERKSKFSAQVSENENTFKAIALDWIKTAGVKKSWTAKYLKQVSTVMADDVFPYVGALPVRVISPEQMLAVLERIENRGAHTIAIMARQWCSSVFRYAISRRKTDYDPTDVLKGTIQRGEIKHNQPLPVNEIPAFLKALEEYRGFPTTIIALRLLLLTFVRTVELRAATWDEIDFEGAVWRIPAERMKMRDAHIVPLSRQAVELLRALHAFSGGQKWLFHNYRRPSDCMTATTLNRALDRMGYTGRFSCHGFRSTASTILNEMGYRPDVIERQLAHTDRNKVRAIYNRAEYLPERKEMLQYWANYLDNLKTGTKIIPLYRGTAL